MVETLVSSTLNPSDLRRALPQIMAVLVKNTILFTYGMAVGMPTMLIPNLSGDSSDESIVLDQEGISWIASINNLCVPIGCLLSGIVSYPMGRKKFLQFACVPFFCGFAMLGFATQPYLVFAGLSLNGISGGLTEAPALSYTAEITEPRLRGILTSTATVFISLGILFTFLLGTYFPWRTVAIVNGAIPILGFLLLFLLPESPYWLISRKRPDEAKASLAWLRGWTTETKIEKEFQEIEDNINKEASTSHSVFQFNKDGIKPYTKSSFLKPFFLILLTFTLGHFGISPIMAYAVTIFDTLAVPINSYYATTLMGSVNILGSLTSMVTVRSVGKRALTFVSLSGVFFCFFGAALYTQLVGGIVYISDDASDVNSEKSVIALIFIVLVGFSSYLMIYSLPWMIMGEIYHNEIRDVGSGISAGTGYLVGFTANKVFLNMVSALTLSGVFWFYGAVALLGIILMYFLLPETEGRSLMEIQDHYNGKKILDNNMSKAIMP